jgi:hypothetical protein
VSLNEYEINIQALRSLYQIDPAARRLFDDFAGRQRNQRITSVDQVVERLGGPDVTRSDVVRVLRKLDELQAGEFKEGRRGHPNRLEWRYSMIEIGRVASGAIDDIQQTESDDDPFDGTPTTLLDHRFQLRPDLQLDLRLPSDFTEREAARLSDFIKALPFGPLS